jgi:hypothetical protein
VHDRHVEPEEHEDDQAGQHVPRPESLIAHGPLLSAG